MPRSKGCPYLLLAPMEGVGDSAFRKAFALIGGFDEAVLPFIRVPQNAHVKSLAAVYDSAEIAPLLLSPQIMGGDPVLMAAMALQLVSRGAKKIDINCGCPSNTVNGRGAGAALLKSPDHIYRLVRAVVAAAGVPVTVKMRSGYDDTSLLEENLLAAEEGGAGYITLHPRTKLEGYSGRAKWELIAGAKAILKIPVVASGDINTAEDADKIIKMTGCDALMIGRGALARPFLFWEIRSFFSSEAALPSSTLFSSFLGRYYELLLLEQKWEIARIGKLKQLSAFLLRFHPAPFRRQILTGDWSSAAALLKALLEYFENRPLPPQAVRAAGFC